MNKKQDLTIPEGYYLRGYKEGLNEGMDYILRRWRQVVDGLSVDQIDKITRGIISKEVNERIAKKTMI